MNLTAWTVFIFLALASIIAAAPDPGPTSSAVEDSALKVRSLLKRWNNNLICYEDGFQSTKVLLKKFADKFCEEEGDKNIIVPRGKPHWKDYNVEEGSDQGPKGIKYGRHHIQVGYENTKGGDWWIKKEECNNWMKEMLELGCWYYKWYGSDFKTSSGRVKLDPNAGWIGDKAAT